MKTLAAEVADFAETNLGVTLTDWQRRALDGLYSTAPSRSTD